MNKYRFTGIMAVAFTAASFGAYAQNTVNTLRPDYSTTITFSTGLNNLDGNVEEKEIPGVSTSTSADINFNLKGSLGGSSSSGENSSGTGYEAGISVNMAAVYASSSGSSSYVETSDTNHYSLIQPMIDWYEANMDKYGLPYNPCGTKDNSPWPTTVYGTKTGYQFIQGSTVERADDVNWTSEKFADAERLYNDIKSAINTAISQLYLDELGTSNVNQLPYADYSEEVKRHAELKVAAKKEFTNVVYGKTYGKSAGDVIKTAYITVTNVGGVADVRVDFAGQRLTVGNKIKSDIAGQSKKGAAVSVGLKNGLVKGLTASVAAGIAGGEAQNPENYDTARLDYKSGRTGELAVKGNVLYKYTIEPIATTVNIGGAVIASDLLDAKYNGAASVYGGFSRTGDFSIGVNGEAMVLNYKDRTNDNANYKFAYSGAVDANIGVFGLSAFGNATYKSAYFSHKTYTVTEDRFYGRTLDADYTAANLKNALKVKAAVELNPKVLIPYDFATVTVGASGLFYGMEFMSYGFNADAEVTLKNVAKVPVVFFGKADFYKNRKLTVWDDMASLPEQKLMDFTSINCGVKYVPSNQVELSLNYVSVPSVSRRHNERITSVTLDGKIAF